MATKLASGYVDLTVRYSNAMKQISDDFAGLAGVGEKAGRKTGDKFNSALGRQLSSSQQGIQRALEQSMRARGVPEHAGKKWAEGASSSMARHLQSAQNAQRLNQSLAFLAKNGDKAGRQFAINMARQLGVELPVQTRAQRIGERLGMAIGKPLGLAIKTAVGLSIAGVTAAVFGLGVAVKGSFSRYRSLDATAKRFGAMGKSAGQVKEIVEDINEVVDGTPIALDAAADAAAKFITTGMEGKELKDTLEAIANAAGASQADFGDLATIFGQVNNKGKLMGEELQQLAEHGLNVFPLLEKRFGKLPEKVGDAGLTIRDLVAVINGEFGGMAKAAADTIDGAFAQFGTAVKRLGANFLSQVFGDPLSTTEGPGAMAEAINKVTEKLNGLNEWVSSHGPDILGFFANLGMTSITMAQTVVGAFTYITRGIGWFVNLVGDILGGMTKGVAAINRLLGRGEIADELDETAEGMFGWGDALLDTANKSDEAFKSFDKMFFAIADWKLDAQEAAEFTQDLGKAVAEIADKDVILKAPSKEDLDRIDQAKWKIIQIPDSKDVIIRPLTKEATSEINSWREAQGKEPVVFFADANMEPATSDAEAWRRVQEKTPTSVPVQADLELANSQMQQFVDFWSKAIINPQVVVPGAGVPGSNPLQNFAPTGGSQNTGGALTPATSAVQNYLRNDLGFKGTIGGWRPPDGYNEHSSGKALDVMIGSSAEGYSILPNALTRPGVQYVIWDNKMWYPDGTSKPYTGPNPHTDHLHIKTFGDGGAARGPGGPTADKIPAWLSDGEHVLTAAEVQAMGGQGAVYAFRNALHRSTGGSVTLQDLLFGQRGENRYMPPALMRQLVAAGRRRPGNGGVSFFNPAGPGNINPKARLDTSNFSLARGYGQIDESSFQWGDVRDFAVVKPYETWNPVLKRRAEVRRQDPLWNFFAGSGWFTGFADGGAVTLDDLLRQLAQGSAVDPNTTQHGQGQGAQPGPTPEELAAAQGPLTRTEGYIPAGAGSSGQAGTSFASGLLQMGAQAINNVIDQAASAASTAAAAGLAAGTFGAGAPASPAAAAATQAAIGIGTQAAKRGVEYGFQMAGIGIDAVAEILSPFGVPRLFNTDVSAFIPQSVMQPVGVTTGEKAEVAQQHEGTGAPPGPGQLPGGPVQPGQLPGQQPVGAPAQMAQPGGVAPGPVPLPGVDQAAQAMPTAQPAPPPQPEQPAPTMNPLEDMWHKLGIFDQGGVLQPGHLAFNASKRPEPMAVFNHDQWGTLDALANTRVADLDPQSGSGVNFYDTWYVTVKDVDELEQKQNDRRRRQAKRYGSRPMGGL